MHLGKHDRHFLLFYQTDTLSPLPTLFMDFPMPYFPNIPAIPLEGPDGVNSREYVHRLEMSHYDFSILISSYMAMM
jgi:hypothetical protein